MVRSTTFGLGRIRIDGSMGRLSGTHSTPVAVIAAQVEHTQASGEHCLSKCFCKSCSTTHCWLDHVQHWRAAPGFFVATHSASANSAFAGSTLVVARWIPRYRWFAGESAFSAIAQSLKHGRLQHMPAAVADLENKTGTDLSWNAGVDPHTCRNGDYYQLPEVSKLRISPLRQHRLTACPIVLNAAKMKRSRTTLRRRAAFAGSGKRYVS
jgi:hypothetical protein